MTVTLITENNLKEMLLKKEITLITKKARKEISVFVADVWEKENIIVGWYTNRYGKLAVKQFNMNQYDFCI